MTGRSRIIAGIVAIALLGGAAAAFAIVWRPAIAAVEPPGPRAFDAALVKRGRDLAAIGNCNNCHTERGGRNFAGGLPVPTPFGTIFSSNITPDAETGIGRWSEAAFQRAMRSGVNREGQHLYPTFPYDHFTNVSDEDDRALYAFLMTRQPVRAPARENQLSFPFNQRFAIAGWKLLFLRHDTYRPIPAKAPNGTAGHIWSKGWRIAAPVTRHAMRWVPNATARSLPAAMSTIGTPMRSTISPTRRCLGMPMPCSPICAKAGTPTTARRAGRWRRWSAICRRSRQAMSARSPSTWPAYRERRRRIANVRARPRGSKPNHLRSGFPNQRGRCVDLRCGLCIMPRERAAAAVWWDQSGAQHRNHWPRSAQSRQYRAVRRPGRRRRAQPDHARICRQHDRCAGFGPAGLSACAFQQPAALVWP